MTPPAPDMVEEQRHPLIRRLTHWLFALAILIMIGSGWRIYNDVPILPFRFPIWASLGGDTDYSYAQHGECGTANAISWHLAGMWLLVASVATYALYGIFRLEHRLAATTPCRRCSTGASCFASS